MRLQCKRASVARVFERNQVTNVADQQHYGEKLSAWECERERQKVEFTITENDVDADLRMPSPEVRHSFLVFCTGEVMGTYRDNPPVFRGTGNGKKSKIPR